MKAYRFSLDNCNILDKYLSSYLCSRGKLSYFMCKPILIRHRYLYAEVDGCLVIFIINHIFHNKFGHVRIAPISITGDIVAEAHVAEKFAQMGFRVYLTGDEFENYQSWLDMTKIEKKEEYDEYIYNYSDVDKYDGNRFKTIRADSNQGERALEEGKIKYFEFDGIENKLTNVYRYKAEQINEYWMTQRKGFIRNQELKLLRYYIENFNSYAKTGKYLFYGYTEKESGEMLAFAIDGHIVKNKVSMFCRIKNYQNDAGLRDINIFLHRRAIRRWKELLPQYEDINFNYGDGFGTAHLKEQKERYRPSDKIALYSYKFGPMQDEDYASFQIVEPEITRSNKLF